MKTATSKVQTPLADFTGENLNLVDRARELKQLTYALLTKEHMLLMGNAGLAKSMFAINAFKSIDGNSTTFEIHLTKQTTEEYVFGPINIEELKKGNVIHNTKDSLLDADFAFIDEFFDASDVLLRSLLGVLNERTWMKGSQKVHAKLHTAILTSNYQRENEITQAILDRIIFKAEIQPTTEKTKRMKIYENYLDRSQFSAKTLIDLKKLQEYHKLLEDPKEIIISKDILQAFDLLYQEYQKESKKYISQRTANKALTVLKAAALLDNRKVVDYVDLQELKYVFCVLNNKMEEGIFDAVYEKHIGKMEEERIAKQALELIEKEIKNIPTDFSNLTDQEFIGKMREVNEYVFKLESMQTPTQPIESKRNEILRNLRQVIEQNRDKLFLNKSKNNNVEANQSPTEEMTEKAIEKIENKEWDDYDKTLDGAIEKKVNDISEGEIIDDSKDENVPF